MHRTFLLLLICCCSITFAWIPQRRIYASPSARPMTASALDPQNSQQQEDSKFEYVEYDYLTEADFINSEWVVGTLFGNDKKIQETWVRLARTEDGKNVCFWGTKQQGTWNLDVASQFLSISREQIYGKQIWACTVDDYYYLQGTVRGWAFWKAASVYGQWQAARLGVDEEEAGPAPWFQEDGSDDTAASIS
ncbi:hypothetical protein MPSEU_000082600 [Mayamaea pseudoterrestris]|nr:hypothetical protein MPSEU_000082600 [Mayamaea pseudoterrestris]